MTTTVTLYPPCALTDAYPILRRVPPECRAAYVEQAEAGIAPTPEQSIALGFHPSIQGGALVPVNKPITAAQAEAGFKGGTPALRRLAHALEGVANERA